MSETQPLKNAPESVSAFFRINFLVGFNLLPFLGEFENYLAKIPDGIPYEEFVLDEMLAMADFIFQGFEFNESLVEPLSQKDLDKWVCVLMALAFIHDSLTLNRTPTCQDLIEDYGYFLHVSKKFDHPLNNSEFR